MSGYSPPMEFTNPEPSKEVLPEPVINALVVTSLRSPSIEVEAPSVVVLTQEDRDSLDRVDVSQLPAGIAAKKSPKSQASMGSSRR